MQFWKWCDNVTFYDIIKWNLIMQLSKVMQSRDVIRHDGVPWRNCALFRHDVTIKWNVLILTFHDVIDRNYITILWDALMENYDIMRCDYVMIRGDAIMWRLITRCNMVRWLKLVQRNRSTAITTGERGTRWLRDFNKNFKFFSFCFLGEDWDCDGLDEKRPEEYICTSNVQGWKN
jgi:hypothetical protein